MALLALTTGCASMMVTMRATKLGYYPENPASENKGEPPTYSEVREWAMDVADGYDSRQTMNRYAIYMGAFTAVAAAGALAGLSAFAPGSSAIIGIPIGTTFLAGTFGFYQNDHRAVIYDLGARAVKDVVTLNDMRWAACADPADRALQAFCLRNDVNQIMRAVQRQLDPLDPKEVEKALAKVKENQQKVTSADATIKQQEELRKAAGADTKAIDEKIAKAKADKQAALDAIMIDLGPITVSKGDLEPPRTSCSLPEGYAGPVLPMTTTTTTPPSTTTTSMPSRLFERDSYYQ